MSQDGHSNKKKEDTIAEARRAREERQNVKAKQSAAITIQVSVLLVCDMTWSKLRSVEIYETKDWPN